MGANNSSQMSRGKNTVPHNHKITERVANNQEKRYKCRSTASQPKALDRLVGNTRSTQGENVATNEMPNAISHDSSSISLESRSCPICFECSYKTPKLLPCSHTFCLPCLRNHLKNNPSNDVLVCPMCRARIHIPEGGLKDLPVNYFVAADKPDVCDKCRDDEGKDKCDYCENILCTACKKKHKCQTPIRKPNIFRLNSSSNSSVSSDTDSDSSSNRSEASVPCTFTRPQKPWTKILLKELFKFRLNEDKKCISILPISPEEAWILQADIHSEMASLELFDKLGNIKQTRNLQSLSVGFAVEKSKSFLVTHLEEMTICRYSGSESTTIVTPSTFHPLGIAIFQNGDIIVTGFDQHNLQECALGCVKIFEPSGKEISHFITGYENIPYITCVLTDDLIVFTYPDNNFVDIRLRDGHVVGRYNGNNNEDDNSFQPVDLCRGHYCKNPVVFVSDSYSDTIHVISYAAEFVGLAVKARISGNSDLGEPGALCFDPRGRLWVEDRDENIITINDIYKYSNVME